MLKHGAMTVVLLLTANTASAAEIAELPKSLHGHYTVWASIGSEGKISAKPGKENLPLFFVGPNHVVTIGVGMVFDRIEKTEVGEMTVYTCHPHAGSGGNASDIVIENLGGGVLLFSEKGEHLLCKKTERTLGIAAVAKQPGVETAGKRMDAKVPAKGAKGPSVSQVK